MTVPNLWAEGGVPAPNSRSPVPGGKGPGASTIFSPERRRIDIMRSVSEIELFSSVVAFMPERLSTSPMEMMRKTQWLVCCVRPGRMPRHPSYLHVNVLLMCAEKGRARGEKGPLDAVRPGRSRRNFRGDSAENAEQGVSTETCTSWIIEPSVTQKCC